MNLSLKILIGGVLLLLVACGAGYVYLHSQAPVYSGTQRLEGLGEEVEVIFDSYGIPHIYAQSETDAYFALGYVHAQERLFQMEMIRRVATGRLSEILGKELLQTDMLFRTLGIAQHSEASVASWNKNPDGAPHQQAALAYLKGINQFIKHGDTPVEFTMLGIEKAPFTPENLYDINAFMAFGFAMGFKIDPLLQKIKQEWGPEYLKDWVIHHHKGDQVIPEYRPDSTQAPPTVTYSNKQSRSFAADIHRIVTSLPVPPLVGSNSWVIGPQKSASGKVILANDPHIGYGQPSVWYEAHLEAPGFGFYGYHLAGYPFAPVGHTRQHAFGLTMLQNDDTNFYVEKVHPDNPDQVWVNDHWENTGIREEVIRIKEGQDTTIRVRMTRHGPIINDVFSSVEESASEPVSLWWLYLKVPSTLLEASYQLSHAQDMSEVRAAAATIAAPGLNIMYGDNTGNIAWWGSARLAKFPPGIDTKLFLDGAGGKAEIVEYHPFTENPRSENPPSGYVYSANNQPALDLDHLHPGYYAPQDRAKRIVALLEGQEKWSAAQVREMITDNVSATKPQILAHILPLIQPEGKQETEGLRILSTWQGDHGLESVGPTLYYTFLYHLLYQTLADELGDEDFEAISSTFLMKRTFPVLVQQDSSRWWDNVKTEGAETRSQVVNQAFSTTVEKLSAKLKGDVSEWQWKKVHKVQHQHLIGRQPPFDKAFNVGPFPAPGGNEVINNIGFTLNGQSDFMSTYGPSRRTVIDFADVENSMSILPTGQSGNVMSPHYADQAEMYVKGEFRKQMMNREEIVEKQESRLVLKPGN